LDDHVEVRCRQGGTSEIRSSEDDTRKKRHATSIRRKTSSGNQRSLGATVQHQATDTTSDTRGELTDEDSNKTEREADAVAQTAPIRRQGTPIPKHVQMGRYHPSNTASLRQADKRGDMHADTAIIDTRSEGWRAKEVRATPTSTEHRVTIRDLEDLIYTAPRTIPEKTMAITYPQLSAINATPAEVATNKVPEKPEAARVAPPSALATTEDATPKGVHPP